MSDFDPTLPPDYDHIPPRERQKFSELDRNTQIAVLVIVLGFSLVMATVGFFLGYGLMRLFTWLF